MDLNFYAAAIIGFIPSFGILYFAWGKLEGLFSEKKLFLNYFIGWILGIIIAIFFLITMIAVWGFLDLSILFILFFGMFTELVKYVYLNRPKIRGDYALTYYGFALGLGLASIWNLALTYYYLRYASMINLYEYAGTAISLLLLSLAMASIHASTGALIGYGIYTKNWEKYLLQSFAFQIMFNISLLPYIWGLPYPLYFWGIIVGIPVLYFKVYKGVLISTIPAKVMKKWVKTRELH